MMQFPYRQAYAEKLAKLRRRFSEADIDLERAREIRDRINGTKKGPLPQHLSRRHKHKIAGLECAAFARTGASEER